MEIRDIIGDMPFDREGRHATGRERTVWNDYAQGYVWEPEYEGDDTIDLPNTETEEKYQARYMEYEEEQKEQIYQDDSMEEYDYEDNSER